MSTAMPNSIQQLLQSWDALANSTATSLWETAYRQSRATAAQELRNALDSLAAPTESALIDLARICGATITGPENADREYVVFSRRELVAYASMCRFAKAAST